MFSSVRLPQVVPDTEAGGGFVTNLKALNALSQQNLQNRLLQAQGNLTQQQANFTPYQQATQALSNPSLWLTDEGRKAGANIIAQLPQLVQQGSAGGNGNNLTQLDSKSLGQIILDKILGGSGGASGGNSNPLAKLSDAAGAAGGTTNGNAFAPQQSNQGQAVSGAPYQTPANSIAAANGAGMNLTPNPLQTQEALAEQQKEALAGQTAAQTAQWDESDKRTANGSRVAAQVRNFADEFHRNYKKAHYTGARFGELPTSGTSAAPTWPGQNLSADQLADNASSNLINVMGPSLQPGGSSHITDSNYDQLKSAKLSRAMEPEAEQEAYDKTIAIADRMDQEQKFQTYIKNKYPSMLGGVRDAIWSEYQKKVPPYDFKNGKVVPENNSAKSWQEFLTPQAISSIVQTGEYTPPTKSKKSKYKLEIELPNKKNSNPENPEIGVNEFIQGGKKGNEEFPGGKKPGEGRVEETHVIDGKQYHRIGNDWYES